ncbi:neuropilin and tolloid-like protein 2 isoform X2 [Mytilus galloprovincialis]|uniref:neuropilin and tolloid-like protein 2 isoform X2 n=1 Tax=Mytilus galloprovincialis TaxID=29158 RepID=UPI003F7C7EE2
MILFLILTVMLRFQTYSSLPQLGKKVANLTEGPVKRCRHEYSFREYTSGIFMSPQFPEKYGNELKCVYFFRADDRGRIKITFDLFKLEGPNSDKGCQFDYIDIYNIDLSGFKVLMDRYCGESVPKEFISQQSKLEIVFNTDFTKTLHGFIGHYKFLDENWHQFGMSTIGCGPGFHTGMTGIISSPNYPDNPVISTEPGSRCTWIIKVQDNENILVTMVDLDLSSCSHTRLLFFNGFTVPLYPDENYCGKSRYVQEDLEFISGSSRLVIRYEANPQVDASKFKLVWTAVTKVELGKCHQFLCHETKHCLENKNNGCKTPTYQYCINHSLLCNGLPNCGVTDSSDEARCLNRLVFIVIYVAVPVSAILLILVIALLCFRYRKRKQNVIKMESQKPPQTHWVSPHIRTSDPGSIAAQSATLLTTSFVSDDKNTTDFVDMTIDRRKKIQNRTIENIKSSEMFNKRKERDKNVLHYEGVDVGSNNEDEIHDIVTHNIHLEPQMPNQGLRTHKKRSSYHMMQELNLEHGPDTQLNV